MTLNPSTLWLLLIPYVMGTMCVFDLCGGGRSGQHRLLRPSSLCWLTFVLLSITAARERRPQICSIVAFEPLSAAHSDTVLLLPGITPPPP